MHHSMTPELCKLPEECHLLTNEYNFRKLIKDLKSRNRILDKSLHNDFLNLYIDPLIYFDYGCNTAFVDRCCTNYDSAILDVNKVITLFWIQILKFIQLLV